MHLKGSQMTISSVRDAVLVSSNPSMASSTPSSTVGNRGSSRRAPRMASGTQKALSTAGITKTKHASRAHTAQSSRASRGSGAA